jgi:signal transduction histidine kinase
MEEDGYPASFRLLAIFYCSISAAKHRLGGGTVQRNHLIGQSYTFPRRIYARHIRPLCITALLILMLLPSLRSFLSAQTSIKKNVLILSEVGLSHALTTLITQQVVNGVQETPNRHVEFYTESLDLASFPIRPSREEARAWIDKKYGSHRLDAVVAVGPGAIDFLSKYTQSLFLDVPIVISGASVDQVANPRLDSRFTGTWIKLEPEKTLEVALRLFPDTRHVFVVGGSSSFDKVVISVTKSAFTPFASKEDVVYLTDMEMGALLKRLRGLPAHSIELFTSFFEDSAGNKFVNATKALPEIAAASNAPDFGMSDTYIGHGILGGYVMPFEKQGKITAQIVSELLDGTKAQDIPIQTISSMYMFDWHELQAWHIAESKLPAGSVVMFREPSLWERNKGTWVTVIGIILALSALVAYLQHSRTELKFARDRQVELSSMLINAEEHERSRVAAELHDDFSQRVAILALGLENAQDATPETMDELRNQLHRLLNSTMQLGDDLHTLSHRLHSSTIESLGLVPALSALCKEFTVQQGIRVDLTADEVPRSIDPDAALGVFRIVQEALRNVKKYSWAKDAEVDLQLSDHRLEVTVRDQGRGFDLANLPRAEGLGIRSMEQRARLLGGKFDIHSQFGRGTTVTASVPVKPAARKAAAS